LEAIQIPEEVSERLGLYVYRLVDPRNGETFYVGKGRGSRVLQHVRGALGKAEPSDKIERIREIRDANLEVGHVLHRHGITDEAVAFEVEAAVMECFPAAHNLARGHRSAERGCAHLDQLIERYAAREFLVDQPLLLISIGRYEARAERSLYDQVRGCWKITEKYAQRARLVLGHQRGLVKGVFVPDQWLPATAQDFPWLPDDEPGRIGFVGHEASPEIAGRYMRKRVPERYRKKGAAFPVRFLAPDLADDGCE
jgi:hypothetical protein